jgi:hypothetical protein
MNIFWSAWRGLLQSAFQRTHLVSKKIPAFSLCSLATMSLTGEIRLSREFLRPQRAWPSDSEDTTAAYISRLMILEKLVFDILTNQLRVVFSASRQPPTITNEQLRCQPLLLPAKHV